MSKYDALNPRTELEQTITRDLARAVNKRGLQVKHNGTATTHAAANRPDIEMWDDELFFCVEVTKRMKSQQDGEYQSIKDHLTRVQKSTKRKCFCIFISPETYHRTFSSIRDSNRVNARKWDMKILPLSFVNFELLVTRLIDNPKEEYPKEDIVSLFNRTEEYIDDEAILRLLFNTLFHDDTELKKTISVNEQNKHQKTVQALIADLLRLEDDMRKNGIATHNEAIKNVIYLVFIKLYEEKRECEQKQNRFSRTGFVDFQNNVDDQRRACHKLFQIIKQDRDMRIARMFNEHDLLAEKMTDRFVYNNFVEPFEKYFFYTTKVDGLGAAYEVLGQLSGKDTKAGQFFTPENVVRFMVMLIGLKSDDIVLDPACGTGRFLIYSMYDMIDKISGGNRADKEERIKYHQLFGSDFDSYVSKLSKMNMYIHGDGKTNIEDKDGLLLFDKDSKVDAILTNPPLGNLDYRLETYNDDFLKKRMAVIPKKNFTQEKIDKLQEQISKSPAGTKRDKLEEKLTALRVELKTNPNIVVTGNEMKGGALFLNSAWHYLKSQSNTDMPIEWRGGKLAIIVDEGLLNTDDYSDLRRFITTHFYVKAVISLTQDTFVPVSKTLTKTSVLYLIKKGDIDVTQKEPVFFAYVDKVGLNTKRKVCDNHLFDEVNKNTLIEEYNRFREAVLSSYSSNRFNAERLLSSHPSGTSQQIQTGSYYYIRSASELKDRLDFRFYDPRFDEIKKYTASKSVQKLGDLVEEGGVKYGLTASGKEYGDIAFVNIENLTEEGVVNHDNMRFVDREDVEGGHLLKLGDVLISRSRLIGLCSVVKREEVNCTYGSYIIRFRLDTSKCNPLFVARFFNSEKGKLQTELLKTGSAGENINSDQLLSVAIPKILKSKQEELLEEMRGFDDAFQKALTNAYTIKAKVRALMDAV